MNLTSTMMAPKTRKMLTITVTSPYCPKWVPNYNKILLSTIVLLALVASKPTTCKPQPFHMAKQQLHNQHHNPTQHHNSLVQSLQQPSNGECGPQHPCLNGGSCVENDNKYTCMCPDTFTGPYCGQDVNECAKKPSVCQNGATCIDKPGGYQCICVNGWVGDNCSENVDDCVNAACEANATCHDRVGHFYCECPPGRTGMLCQLEDGCFSNPCHHNATCDTSPVDGRPTCICPHGYHGPTCSFDIDECAAGSPCEHGGVCVNTPGEFKCECPKGFKGTRCEININECDTNPCQNDATCLDEKGGYKCICTQGYTGQNCQINIDECAQNPCQNGATCTDLNNSFRCTCQSGFWGERCEFPPYNRTQIESENTLGAGNPWNKCSYAFECWTNFKDGKCDEECNNPECLYDGFDCNPHLNRHPMPNQLTPSPKIPTVNLPTQKPSSISKCDASIEEHCSRNYANQICDIECNNLECGWDGGDCDISIPNDLPGTNAAQGSLVIRVEPPITFGNDLDSTQSKIMMNRLLRNVSLTANTMLKTESWHSVDDGRGTEIVLTADNSKCQTSCYNTTDLIAKFLSALKAKTRELDVLNVPNAAPLTIKAITSQDSKAPRDDKFVYVLISMSLALSAVVVVSMTAFNNGQKVKEKAVTWFPEGFAPVLTSRNRDPTNRRPHSRGVSTLQALGGNFFRGMKKNERRVSTDPSGMLSTDIDRCNMSTPNGGGIYHEPYDQYDQYGGTYNGTDAGSIMNGNMDHDHPLTPATMTLDPINLEGPHGMTPLMVASMGHSGFPKTQLGLIAYGTTGEVNSTTDNNVADLLNRGAQLTPASKHLGETALHLAARYGRVDNARSIIERSDSTDVNAKDHNGRTPLHSAIAADSRGVFELLTKCRTTDLNAQTNDGTTPLILATRHGIYSMIEELILNECDVTKTDVHGKTALHWAAATDNVDAIRRLLAVRETNKDAQDAMDETPLFLAAREGAKGAVEILLQHNANKDICDQEERSPTDIAAARQHKDVVRMLEEHKDVVRMVDEHEPLTPKSISSAHKQSRKMSPFPSPLTDTNSNSNHSNPSQPIQQQTTTIYNVPCLKNYMTPSPDSPFSLESVMSSPYQYQYQNPNSTSTTQAGVFI